MFYKKIIKKRKRIIVLTYHSILDDAKNKDITVSIKNFKNQIFYLNENYKIVSIDKIIEIVNKINLIDKNYAAITFDDGYKDNYIYVYPFLKENKLPATIFIITDFIGQNDEWLDRKEIYEMSKGGINFGSHTASHAILSKIDLKLAYREIFISKEKLERILNKKINHFAYPKGKKKQYNKQIKNLLIDLGYRAAFTMENGEVNTGDDIFELNRIGIRNYPLFVFKMRLCGLYEEKILLFFRKLLNGT